MKKKILLAVGDRNLESFIEQKLESEFDFLRPVVYKEAILKNVKDCDIVVIRESLEGSQNILEVIYNIVVSFPNVRIVFMASKRDIGDELLSTLVGYGVYDILYGSEIKVLDLLDLIRKPQTFADVRHLKPIPQLNEKTGKVNYNQHQVIVKREKVYIDRTSDQQNINKSEVEEETQNEETEIQEVQEEKKDISKTFEDTSTNDDKKSSFSLFGKRKKEEVPVQEPQRNKTSQKTIKQDKTINIEENNNNIRYNDDAGYNESNKELTNKKEELFQEELFREMTSSKPQKKGFFSKHEKKKQIITFVGGKSGVGNTSIAFNTAIYLAQQGNKTLYLEIDEVFPNIRYLYNISGENSLFGIDTALKGIIDKKYYEVNKSILKMKDLKNLKNTRDSFKKMPDNFDIMIYSDKYLIDNRNGEKQNLDMNYMKELYFYLMVQYGYDYIILDIKSDIKQAEIFNAIIYSNKIFLTITQDVTSIAQAISLSEELKKQGIDIEPKTVFILNKYEKAKLRDKNVKEWLETDSLITIPCLNKEFYDSNFEGIPVSLYCKNSLLKEAFKNIESVLI